MTRDSDLIDGSFCSVCNLDHSTAARLFRLKRALPATVAQLVQRYPCLYGKVESGEAQPLLFRDLKAVGARSESLWRGDEPEDAEWAIP